MRARYDEQVDALYIRLKETSYHESDEIREAMRIFSRTMKINPWRCGISLKEPWLAMFGSILSFTGGS